MTHPSRPGFGRRTLIPVLGGAVVSLALAGCGPSGGAIPVSVPLTTTTNATPTLGPVTPGRSNGGHTQLVSVGGEQRSYRIHTPLTAPPGPRPLVIALHGGASSPQTMEYSIGLDNVADRLGLIVVYPEAVGGFWNNGRERSVKASGGLDDVAFLAAVLKDVRKRQQVDTARIFMVGQGDGGIMAMDFAGRRKGVLAGVAVVSAQLVNSYDFHPPTQPISVVIIHGTSDPAFPAGGTSDASAGLLRSVRATTDYFLNLNGLSGAGKTTAMPDRDPSDGTSVRRTVWEKAGADSVALYTVKNGGYPWPGGVVSSRSLATKGRTSRDLDASSVVGHFALEVRLSGPQ
jgi:polyhydroxybutyrate depolymerase